MTNSKLPSPLRCETKASFAFATANERWPKIITKLVDQMHKYQRVAVQEHGEEGDLDIKSVIAKLSEMRYRLMTDKPLVDVEPTHPDAQIWNQQLEEFRKEDPNRATWYKLPWLFVECYLYRKINEYYWLTKHYKAYDPFQAEKHQSYEDSLPHLVAIGTEIVELEANPNVTELKNMILRLLQISLWGNKADLSLSCSDPHQISSTLFHQLDELEPHILVNDLDKAVNSYLMRPDGEAKQIDIILDNAGLEVFVDLCLGELLRFQNLASIIVFHGKTMPWFVSDTTKEDLTWVLDSLEKSDNKSLHELSTRWKKRFQEGDFVFQAHPFWTYNFPYSEMKRVSPELYEQLEKSSFLIFKGDLNYRKLVGDLEWKHDTPFKTSLNGFEPQSFIVLRTLKAEVVTGFSQKALDYIKERFKDDDKSWMVSSDYAVAQMFEKK